MGIINAKVYWKWMTDAQEHCWAVLIHFNEACAQGCMIIPFLNRSWHFPLLRTQTTSTPFPHHVKQLQDLHLLSVHEHLVSMLLCPKWTISRCLKVQRWINLFNNVDRIEGRNFKYSCFLLRKVTSVFSNQMFHFNTACPAILSAILNACFLSNSACRFY